MIITDSDSDGDSDGDGDNKNGNTVTKRKAQQGLPVKRQFLHAYAFPLGLG